MTEANSALTSKSGLHIQMGPHVDACDALHRGSSEYYSLQRSVFEHAAPFVTPKCRIVDLASSSGDMLAPFVETFEDLCRFIALDREAENAYSCLDRFRVRVRLGYVEVAQLDLTERFPEVCSRISMALLELGNLDHVRQNEVLHLAYKYLERGGAFILAERVSNTAEAGQWEIALHDAGFGSVRRFWSRSGVAAWIATK